MLTHSPSFLVSSILINMHDCPHNCCHALVLDTRGTVCLEPLLLGTIPPIHAVSSYVALSSPTSLISEGWALNPRWANQSPSLGFSQLESENWSLFDGGS